MNIMAFRVQSDELQHFRSAAQSYQLNLSCQAAGLNATTAALTDGCDGVCVTDTCDLSAPVLQKLRDNGVRFVATRAMGCENIDLVQAQKLGMRVSRASFSPYCVANYTVMLILMCIRKANQIISLSNASEFSLHTMRGREMQNLVVGIIGTGKIGSAVANNLSGFGCRILAFDPKPDPDLTGVTYVPLETLYAQSDVITLHTSLSDETFHMINGEAIAKMKPGVVLINAARSDLIDTRALIHALESGHVGGAGVDCFEDEVDVIHTDHDYRVIRNYDLLILNSFPNAIVTPHMAFYTDQAVADKVYSAIESLYRFGNDQLVPLEVSV